MTDNTNQVVSLTMNPSIDLSINVRKLQPAHKLRGQIAHRDPGGGGINVSRAISSLGGQALAIFPAGGPSGMFLQKLLETENVSCRVQEIGGINRENFTVYEEDSDHEYRFVLPGPELTSGEWQSFFELLDALKPVPQYLVASGSLPPGVPEDFYARVARWARAAGVRLVLDTSGPALKAALDEGVYLIKPNRRELKNLSSQPIENADDEEQFCRKLIEKGQCEVIALTLGKEGAMLVTDDEILRIKAPALETKSSVGAGDSFVAGMVLGLVRKLSLQKAFCYGNAAGAAALLTPGTKLCLKEDVERLYEQICSAELNT
ncbi:MAG: 1-phosphofructokinase family hexose kinase [Pelovirga sp.]